MEQPPELNDTPNKPPHQGDEQFIQLLCNIRVPLKSLVPLLKTFAGIGTGIVIGASSSGYLPPPEQSKLLHSPTPAPQVEVHSQPTNQRIVP
jgi:hypothetical protein